MLKNKGSHRFKNKIIQQLLTRQNQRMGIQTTLTQFKSSNRLKLLHGSGLKMLILTKQSNRTKTALSSPIATNSQSLHQDQNLKTTRSQTAGVQAIFLLFQLVLKAKRSQRKRNRKSIKNSLRQSNFQPKFNRIQRPKLIHLLNLILHLRQLQPLKQSQQHQYLKRQLQQLYNDKFLRQLHQTKPKIKRIQLRRQPNRRHPQTTVKRTTTQKLMVPRSNK